MLEYVKSSDAKAVWIFLLNCTFFSRSYIYVQLFHFNSIEKDLYIAIKVKLLERFKVIFINNTGINISKTTFTSRHLFKFQKKKCMFFMYNLIFELNAKAE